MSLTQAANLVGPVLDGMEATETVLARLLADESPALTSLVGHLDRYAGKRVRPALVHLCAGLVGKPTPHHAVLGALVEALHLASLLHDDVLDDADTRRRSVTLNALCGNQVPVLLGDYIYARSFAMALELPSLHAASELALASQALCRGEIEQSFFRFGDDFDEERYFRIIRGKTASLFETACRLGTRFADGDDELIVSMGRFGLDLGVAFQIVDDCLDLVGVEERVGKSLGTDLETGKVTLPLIRLARRLQGSERDLLRSIVLGEVKGSRREALRRAFDVDEVVEECRDVAQESLDRCRMRLEPFDDGPEKRSLLDICGFVLHRSY